MSSKSFTGFAPAYDAKFPFTIPTRMAVLEPDVEWVRQPPQDAITDPDFSPFTSQA